MTSGDRNVIVSHFHEYAMRGGDVTNDMFQKYFNALERYERLPRNSDKRLDSYASPLDQELMHGPFGHTRTFPELHQAFQTNTPGIWATVVNTMGPLVISGLVDVAGLYFRYKEGAQIKAQEAENKASEYRLKMVGTIVGAFSWMMGN